jgi:hypothetical protein
MDKRCTKNVTLKTAQVFVYRRESAFMRSYAYVNFFVKKLSCREITDEAPGANARLAAQSLANLQNVPQPLRDVEKAQAHVLQRREDDPGEGILASVMLP